MAKMNLFWYQVKVDGDEVSQSNEFKARIHTRHLRLFLSTKRLLKLAKRAKVFQADATYKLIWQGFPVLIVGTSDMDNKFHPLGMAVCSNEEATDFSFIFESLQIGIKKFRPRETYKC
jgi:hypothetical protein